MPTYEQANQALEIFIKNMEKGQDLSTNDLMRTLSITSNEAQEIMEFMYGQMSSYTNLGKYNISWIMEPDGVLGRERIKELHTNGGFLPPFDLRRCALKTIEHLLLQDNQIATGREIMTAISETRQNTRKVIDYLESKRGIEAHYYSDSDKYNGLPGYVRLLDDDALDKKKSTVNNTVNNSGIIGNIGQGSDLLFKEANINAITAVANAGTKSRKGILSKIIEHPLMSALIAGVIVLLLTAILHYFRLV